MGEVEGAPAPNDPSRNLYMKRFLILLPMLLTAGVASADMAELSANMHRIDISNMTCAQVQAELDSVGKAELWWHSKTGLPRYGMYVRDESSCKRHQFWFRASVGTSDMKSPHGCPVMQCNTYGRPANH
jgi:hypothetical protein